jgi:Tfp pilus assembly protein PilN
MDWVSHGVKRGRLELDSRPLMVLLAIGVVLTLVAALYLGLVSRTAAQGRRIEQLQADVFRVQRENQQLAVVIAETSAIPRLMERARALGFVPPEQVEFLNGGSRE